MPLNFPGSPTANDIYTDATTGNRYVWDATNNVWKWSPNTVSLTIQSLVPGSPNPGQLWFNSDLGRLFIYYSDGDSSQWIEASPASGSLEVALLNSYVNVAANLAISAWTASNAAYTTTNAAFTVANSAFGVTNASFGVANAAFNKANTPGVTTGKAIAMAIVFGG
jgi:hypothetical protein